MGLSLAFAVADRARTGVDQVAGNNRRTRSSWSTTRDTSPGSRGQAFGRFTLQFRLDAFEQVGAGDPAADDFKWLIIRHGRVLSG
jgi:hypothetical protein